MGGGCIMVSSLLLVLPLLLLMLLVCPCAAAPAGRSSCTRLFSFGDSITDAGNFACVFPGDIPVLSPPYGETFFRRPTGRFCDGRLIVDFIAEALKLPFSPPYLVGKTAEDFRHGVNFAVAAATALNQSFFGDMGLDVSNIPPYSLDVQLEWFQRVLQQLGSDEQERRAIMASSLFLMGEIGVNDYNFLFLDNRSFAAEIRPLVPKVIQKIENAVKVLIDLGAKTIVVPGSIPLGCLPRYLAMFQNSSSPGDHDAAGCISWLNDFAQHHNRALRAMLRQRIMPRHPTVTVIYGDYYGAMVEIIRNPLHHGFSKDGALAACCGDGGPHNSGSFSSCSNTSAVLCPDPSAHVWWDGTHLTEAAYRFVARGMLEGPYAAPSILSECKCS